MGSSPWRDAMQAAKQMARELSDEPGVRQASAHARRGAQAATRGLDATRRKVTQEEAWDEVTAAVDDLIQVVVVQQRLLDGLVDRVHSLESKLSSDQLS